MKQLLRIFYDLYDIGLTYHLGQSEVIQTYLIIALVILSKLNNKKGKI
jgi:hypothetical protein